MLLVPGIFGCSRSIPKLINRFLWIYLKFKITKIFKYEIRKIYKMHAKTRKLLKVKYLLQYRIDEINLYIDNIYPLMLIKI